MQDAELLRYSRHILLDELGIEGQERIRASRVLLIGAGGLGAPAAMYLACAGVGHLTVADHDHVDLTNLQRQIAHTTASVGWAKVESLRQTLHGLNPHVQVQTLQTRVDAAALDQQVQSADVVLDCSDNFATRQAVNAACVRHRRPLVSGLRSVLMARSACMTHASPRRPATPACSPRNPTTRKCDAPPWGYSRRWWASSVRYKRPKRSS